MNGSDLLGFALGLILVFGLLAVFCSAICEVLSNLVQMRAKYLLRGLRTLLDSAVSDPAGAPGGRGRRRVRIDGLNALHAATLVERTCDAARERVNALATAAERAPDEVTRTSYEVARLPDGLTLALFANPLLRAMQSRRILFRPTSGLRNPAYVSGGLFVRALVDTLVPDGTERTSLAVVTTTLQALPDGVAAKGSLLALARRAGGDLATFETLVEQWYDEKMATVSGWYKRWSRVVLGVIGLVIAVAANIDTLQVARSLYVDQPVRTAVLGQVADGSLCGEVADPIERARCARQRIALLGASGLPIGWSGDRPGPGPLRVLGWALTGLAVSFGAPFWFSALSRLASLRTTGPKPASPT